VRPVSYAIKALFSAPKGTELTLDTIEHGLGAEADYKGALRKMLAGMAAGSREVVMPGIAAGKATFVADNAPSQGFLEAFVALCERLIGIAESTAETIIRLEAKRHSKQFMDIAKRQLGIDLASVITQEGLEEYLRLAAERNASLIRSLGFEQRKRIEQIAYDALTRATPDKTVAVNLRHAFDLSKSRADLIASDQMAKLNSDLNRIRHQQAGIEEYDWVSSLDEKVRTEHKRLHGKRFRYDRPTSEKDGLHPGQPIRCRCIAKAVVRF
jgi:SPP1 gp7 family putative phage head morphogenesis protein